MRIWANFGCSPIYRTGGAGELSETSGWSFATIPAVPNLKKKKIGLVFFLSNLIHEIFLHDDLSHDMYEILIPP